MTTNNEISNNPEETPQADKISKELNSQSVTTRISDIFFMTISHWPWIVASVVSCVLVAYIYLLCQPNVYTRRADILIKDDTKEKTAGMENFADFGLFQSSVNISNEITNLKSKDLMEEVVRRLGLDINYFQSGKFHDEVVYGKNLPVRVNFLNTADENNFSFILKVTPNGNVTISDLDDSGADYVGRLNDTISTSAGKVIVSPTANFAKNREVELGVKKIPLSSATASYAGRLDVNMNDQKSTVLTILFSDQSIERADDVIESLIGVYNENWIRDKNQVAVSTSNFINDRLGVIESELGSVDSDISSYKSANLIPDVQAAASMYMNKNQQTESAIMNVSTQLQMARHIRSYLNNDGSNDQLLPANAAMTNTNIQNMIGDYNARMLQRNSLIANSSDKNPLVRQLDDQLSAQRQAIVRTLDNEIVNLNSQLNSLKGSEAQTISRIASNPTQAKNLLSVERQQKVKESLYLYLLQKREENELSQAFTAYNTRIINRPGSAGVPPKPNRAQTLLIAFLVGLLLPFGVTYAKESTNTKLRGRKDVENLPLPFLGEIPEVSTGGKKKKGAGLGHTLVVKDGKRDIINESFRVLRTNVEFINSGHSGSASVIAITSFNPNSGKSFMSMNLAKALAVKNRRVLVIDGDLRHGSASEFVGSPDKGLSDYLNSTINDINSIIVKDQDSENFYVMPIGSIPPNPTELLETERFGDLIKLLRGSFDYIFIDCPPIEVVADTQIIDKQADRTFFVLRAGLLERVMIPELVKLYEQKKYRNMAYILNGTQNYVSRYGYIRGYRYGYGYGYGYGNGYRYGYGYGYANGDEHDKKRKRRKNKKKTEQED